MSKIKTLFFILPIIAVFFSFFADFFILGADILFTIPSFGEVYKVDSPGNSLIADPVFQFEPWRIYTKERLLRAELPFINDQNALGAPFLANQQSAVFYPLSIIYYLFPAPQSLFLIYFFKLYFFVLFFYLYFRSLSVEKPIALFGSFVTPLIGFFIVWLQWPQTNVFVLLPLLLYLTEKIRSPSKNKYIWNILLALSYFIIVLAGHPETAVHLAIVHALYTVLRAGSIKSIFSIFLFCLAGFLLGAFLALPFLEYLLKSYMLEARSGGPISYLPLPAFIFNLIPFISGAPHLQFYKPAFGVNFQEAIGGYSGLAVFLTGLIAVFRLKKSAVEYFWIFLLIFSWAVAYGVFPFSLFSYLPPLTISSNTRMIGFAGISLIALMVLYLNQLSKEKKKELIGSRALYLSAVFSVPGIILLHFLPTAPGLERSFLWYLDFIRGHLVLLSLSTLTFFLAINFYLRTKRNLFLFIAFLSIFTQTAYLFAGYNSIIDKDLYYPDTNLTLLLSRLPKGVYLEVGNPSLAENLNLAYGLSSLENYDALEIKNFRDEYDKAFPLKNQWANPDTVDTEPLNKFGVRYVISDYDLRMQKVDIQPVRDVVLEPLLKSEPILLSLPQEEVLGLRLLPATFNRQNNCSARFTILDENLTPKHTLSKKCSDFYNNMYFSLNLPQGLILPDAKYFLKLSSDAQDPESAISFYGNGKIPYLAYLKNKDEPGLNLITQGKTWYLFSNPAAKDISGEGEIHVLDKTPERVLLEVDNRQDWVLELKKANFLGWNATIDGRKTDLEKSIFLSLKIPEGRHIVEFKYTPYSFYLGLLVSLVSFLILVFYFLRHVFIYKKVLKSGKFLSDIRQKASVIDWSEHASVLIAASIGYFVLASIILSIIPIHVRPDTTDVINWLNVNHHAKLEDYLYFFTLLVFTFSAAFISWILWIKKH